MSEQSVIVWDLETVPDLAAAGRMLDLPNATEAEVREALGWVSQASAAQDRVHRRQPEGWRVDALGASHIGECTEAKLISDFVEKIGQLPPQSARPPIRPFVKAGRVLRPG
jgi:3'-5' exonuclease